MPPIHDNLVAGSGHPSQLSFVLNLAAIGLRAKAPNKAMMPTIQDCHLAGFATSSKLWERNHGGRERNTYYHVGNRRCLRKKAKLKESPKDYTSILASGSGHPPQATMEEPCFT